MAPILLNFTDADSAADVRRLAQRVLRGESHSLLRFQQARPDMVRFFFSTATGVWVSRTAPGTVSSDGAVVLTAEFLQRAGDAHVGELSLPPAPALSWRGVLPVVEQPQSVQWIDAHDIRRYAEEAKALGQAGYDRQSLDAAAIDVELGGERFSVPMKAVVILAGLGLVDEHTTRVAVSRQGSFVRVDTPAATVWVPSPTLGVSVFS